MLVLSYCNGFKITSTLEKHMVDDDILFTNPRQDVQHLVHYISIVFNALHQWLTLVGTSTNQFGPV